MNAVLSFLKRKYRQFLGLFPETLPCGVAAYQTFIDELIETWDMPTQSRTDVEYVVAMQIMGNSKGIGDRRSRYYFVRCLRAAAQKQVAHARQQEIYHQEKAKFKKENSSEATDAVALDGPTQ